MILGIALGVAVAIAIDLANESASSALAISTETLSGKATHQIIQLPNGLDDGVYTNLRREFGDIQIAPRVTGVVNLTDYQDVQIQLVGMDPIAEAAFQTYLGSDSSRLDTSFSQFFTEPGAAIVGSEFAQMVQLKVGDKLRLSTEGSFQTIRIIGVVTSSDELSRRVLDGVILVDIASAQEILNRPGKLDQIDLQLTDTSPAAMQTIQQAIPSGATLITSNARQQGLNQLTAAFRLNLTALSLLAMTVGMFLIYNTMTFSVIQRRPIFGILRSLGVTRREIFLSVLVESFWMGLAGSAVGLVLGIALGRSTIAMVSQTVNDLYVTTTVQNIALSSVSLIKGVGLGILAALLTAIPPAWEAASVPATETLSRASLESRARLRLPQSVLSSVVAGLLGLGVLGLPTQSLIAGFGGLFLIVLAFALITPFLLVMLMRAIQPLLRVVFQLPGKMAPRNLIQSLSRTSVAVAALMVALAVSLGVNLMIDSFRGTVQTWLDASLLSDIYITAPNLKSNQPTAPIDPIVYTSLLKYPQVSRLDVLKIGYVLMPGGEVQISATDNTSVPYERLFKYRWEDLDILWDRMEAGDVIITEPLANRLGIDQPGQVIRLQTEQGEQDFRVLGVYYDYASTGGTIQMSLDTYRKYWDDDEISAIGIRLQPDVNAIEFANHLQEELPASQRLVIQPNQELRDEVMTVFERTFAITRALQILATLVAFIGIINSLSILQFEKQREMGILRALGFSIRQIWSQVMLETGLMGLAAGLISVPAGICLAILLIDVINQRSFGWTLNLSLTWQPIVQTVMVAILAALLAGIAPARQLGKIQTIEAIRYE